MKITPCVSVIIPSRNEIFLSKTIQDILAKARGEIEVIPVLEGYWPKKEKRKHWSTPAIIDDPRVVYLHHGKPMGMRRSINDGVAIAKGEYVMKVDAHCMFGEGFDVILAENCKENWVAVPTRKRLDPEKWGIRNGQPPINYLYLEPLPFGDRIEMKEWRAKNRDRSFDKKEIDDILSCQGSCYFLPKKYYYELELLDEKNYGTFRKDPQEVTFKAWTSGGRVVRNKKTWYAHLHKGKQYGRGYHASKSDWSIGDEYVKKWWTGSAWKKQKKSFKWLVKKFPDMPGWENHEWFRNKPKLYQNIGEKEGEFRWQNPKKKNSKFWNEGKWNNFIAPLLPKDCSELTFVEVGCNAGLFLKLAKEKGFRNIVGIDKDKKAIEEGKRYKDKLSYDYKLLHREVGKNFDFNELPVADVFLLSTVHYYFEIQDWLEFLDKLQYKARYCLLVSRSIDKDQHWKPSGELADLKNYFKHWQEIGAIADVSTRGDPSPRELWSIMFESDMARMDIDKIYIKNQRHRTWVEDYKKMNEAKIKLAEQIAKDDNVKMEGTDYYKRWAKRKGRSWSEEKIREFVGNKIELMYDVKRNGLKEPLIVKSYGQICDGGHRLAILRALKHKSVIVRVV